MDLKNLLAGTKGKRVMALAFSFGLLPDGGPGAANMSIARCLSNDLSLGVISIASAQWEVVDALNDLGANTSGFIVAEPPEVTATDIVQAGTLRQCLVNPTQAASQAAAVLLSKCPSLAVCRRKCDQASLINHLIRNPRFHEDFTLDLRDLDKSSKGLIGLEKRSMPRSAHYPNGLRRYQSIRVGRLICEEVLKPALRPGSYLNTFGVALQALSKAKKAGQRPNCLAVYCVPDHRDWCRKNIESAWRKVFGAKATLPTLSYANVPNVWNPESAQVWVRDRKTYLLYNSLP